jgi:hypothetical protein
MENSNKVDKGIARVVTMILNSISQSTDAPLSLTTVKAAVLRDFSLSVEEIDMAAIFHGQLFGNGTKGTITVNAADTENMRLRVIIRMAASFLLGTDSTSIAAAYIEELVLRNLSTKLLNHELDNALVSV